MILLQQLIPVVLMNAIELVADSVCEIYAWLFVNLCFSVETRHTLSLRPTTVF